MMQRHLKKESLKDQKMMFDFFIEIGARVQGYCGVKCKECGWEKKANAKSEELETQISFQCIKANYQLKENI